jgi:peptidoglycan/LPS O-acetylase OafA/YrhL
MAQQKEQRTELLALTSLRGLAAIWVLLFHLRHEIKTLPPLLADWIRPFIGQGYLGVDLFFVLSGFVIAYNYGERFRRFSPNAYARFLGKRFARIYPAHLFALLLCVAAFWLMHLSGRPIRFSGRYDLASLIQSILLIQGWTFPIAKKWNVPDWSVSTEWLAYILFPLLAFGVGHFRRIRGPLSTLFVVLGLNFLLFGVIVHRQSAMAFGLVRIACCFSLGVCLARAWELGLRPPKNGTRWGLLLLLASAPFFDGLRKTGFDPLALSPLIFLAVVFLLSGTRRKSGGFSGPTFLWLGHISYALYLVHGVILSTARGFGILDWLPTLAPSARIFLLLVEVLVMVALAHAVHRWVENPARVGMVSWLMKAASRGDQADANPQVNSVRLQST